MSYINISKINEILNILNSYEGNDPYILWMKSHNITNFNDLQIEYILNNKNGKSILINKIVRISDWFGKKLQEKYFISFVPSKIFINEVFGSTNKTIYCSILYKKNQNAPINIFIPKSGLLDDIFANDYKSMNIDVSYFNNILKKYDRHVLPHQIDAIKFLLTNKKCILADDQGLGKTFSTIMASIYGKFKKILIICPSSVKSVWKKEISYFEPSDSISIISQGKKCIWDRKWTIINYDLITNYHKLPLVPDTETVYDGLIGKNKEVLKTKRYKTPSGEIKEKILYRKSRKKEIIEEAIKNSILLQNNYDLVIIDECHKLSNNTSDRYEYISDFIRKSNIKYLFGLSGTPITNRPMNYYNILSLIGHSITSNWDFYVKRYCDGRKINRKDGRKIWITNGASNLDELMIKTSSAYLRRLKSEIPGLPDKTIVPKFYDLDESERIEYESLWSEYEDKQWDLGNIDLNKELIEDSILRKFISMKMVSRTIETANEILEDGEKVIIMCWYVDEINAFKEYFKNKCVVYKGGMSEKQKLEAENQFMNNPNVTVFIGNIIAAGVGLTLTSAHYLIFNTFSYVPGDNEQAQDRCHRISQKHDVTIIYQLFNNTVSEDIWNAVLSKKLIIDQVIKEENKKINI